MEKKMKEINKKYKKIMTAFYHLFYSKGPFQRALKINRFYYIFIFYFNEFDDLYFI